MTLLTIRTTVLAGLGRMAMTMLAMSLATAGSVASHSAKAAAVQYAAAQCMEDDGYGRLRPCSADYKQANPNWESTDRCMEDDGYGRMRPCSADYKTQHQGPDSPKADAPK